MNMNTRREFLSLTLKGATMVAATGFLAEAAAASDTADMAGSTATAQTLGGNGEWHYKPPLKFGMGGVPLGNEFEVVTDEDAYATIEAAWNAGVRYYDMAPWYGLGLAERRYGNFLHNKERSEYVLSTKVGKLLKASKTAKNKEYFPFSPSPNDVIYDYTASGVRRSIEDTLQRLGIDSLDIAFVHDISSDNKNLPPPWPEQFEIARKGAFPELTRMREEGLIKGWGNRRQHAGANYAIARSRRSGYMSSGLSIFSDRPQECAGSGVPRGQSEERVFRCRVIPQRRLHLGKSTLQLREGVIQDSRCIS